MSQSRLLVTGASGQLGRLVLDKLLESQPPARLIAVTRDPARLADLAARGVEVRRGSFDDPAAALADAFRGAERILLVSTDALDAAGTRLAQHRNAVDAAKRAGAKHVVYTSLTRCDPGLPITFAPDHYGTERALAESGVDYTVLRNNWYAEIVAHTALQAAAGGQLFSATGGRGVSAISRDDCAVAAAAALVRGPRGKEVLEITGAVAVTFDELAALAAAKTGTPVKHVALDRASFLRGLVEHGVPAPLAEVFASFHDAIARGDLGVVTNDFETLTGRAPTPVAAQFR
jgi:NAD(P)H dehydrogenase (quinone)